MLKDLELLDAEDSIPAHVPDPNLKEEINLEEESWKEKFLKEDSLALAPVVGLIGQMMQLTCTMGTLVSQQAARLDALAAHVGAQENLLKEVLEKKLAAKSDMLGDWWQEDCRSPEWLASPTNEGDEEEGYTAAKKTECYNLEPARKRRRRGKIKCYKCH